MSINLVEGGLGRDGLKLVREVLSIVIGEEVLDSSRRNEDQFEGECRVGNTLSILVELSEI